MKIDQHVRPADLRGGWTRALDLGGRKAALIDRTWDASRGTPVYTVRGKYTTRGWTEWTQGFQYGCALLAFDGAGDRALLEMGRSRTLERMAPHLTHVGVHDHGFNNLSTYGNLRRFIREGKLPADAWEARFYDLALRCSGAVQAARWSDAADGDGYICSFNGPHSLFIDTMRTLRVVALAHQLGHVLMGENDRAISLLGRAITHARTTARRLIFDGRSGHAYDVRGRTAHEGVFNRTDGRFRARATQQGYSPFSTWTRGLAWAMLGFAEQMEFLRTVGDREIRAACGLAKARLLEEYEATARATCDHYLDDCAALDGIVYWDDGAPGLAKLGDWRGRPADPFNEHEPVDASASAIAAQGLIRLGRALGNSGARYLQAGLTIARVLLAEPYLSVKPSHQGLLLHSVYHRPNGWDHIPAGRKTPCGESSLWGDYHLLELCVLIQRLAENGPYPTFFS